MSNLMYKSEYATMYRTEEELWWYLGLRDTIKYFITNQAATTAAVLDAGCGTGKNMEFLTGLGYRNIEGFDFSVDAVEFCKKRGLSQVKQGNIMDIQYPNATFDVVYSMDVLGILDPVGRQKAVSELYRVLKPGGIFLCNGAALEIFRSQHDDVTSIQRRFTKQDFKDLFAKNNFQVIKLSYRVFLLSPLVLIFKLIKRITGLFTKGQEAESDQVIFPFGINWMLLQVQLLENGLFKRFNFPFGSSVFIVTKKVV
jgi:SAM-dependent methyltransferase